MIFPREAFDSTINNPLAAAAVTAMIYVGAVVADDEALIRASRLVRPSTCLWMQEEVLERTSDADREAWFRAATAGNAPRNRIADVVSGWGIAFKPWYGDNTRETLRDETLPAWHEHGAIRSISGLPTTSSRPRWVLPASFAALFDPALAESELALLIEVWRETRMSPIDRYRIRTGHDRQQREHAVMVTLPNGDVRALEAGDASHILKGLIEQWAPARLGDPVVLTVSEPGDKVYTADRAQLAALGIAIDVRALLPDAVIVDIAPTPPEVWIIEAVATDGPVTEERKRLLLEWAANQAIPAGSCRFLSAFLSRNHAASKRRLKDIAVGTLAWYLDEPTRELSWHEITR
jgi:hypothetical protein